MNQFIPYLIHLYNNILTQSLLSLQLLILNCLFIIHNLLILFVESLFLLFEESYSLFALTDTFKQLTIMFLPVDKSFDKLIGSFYGCMLFDLSECVLDIAKLLHFSFHLKFKHLLQCQINCQNFSLLLLFWHFSVKSLQHWTLNHSFSFLPFFIVFNLFVYDFVVWIQFVIPFSLFGMYFLLDWINQWFAIGWYLFVWFVLTRKWLNFVSVTDNFYVCLKTILFEEKNVLFQRLTDLSIYFFGILTSIAVTVNILQVGLNFLVFLNQ